ATVSLYNVVDTTGSITLNGPAVNVTIPTPGQQEIGRAACRERERVSALLRNSTITGCWTRLAILKPDGSQLAYADTCGSSVFLEPLTLPVPGTDTLLLVPPGASTGQATVSLYNVVDTTGSITPNGPAVNVTIPTPGQQALLSFAGTAGQRVSALLSN